MALSGVAAVAHAGEELRLALAASGQLPALVLDSSNSRTFSIAIAAWSRKV